MKSIKSAVVGLFAGLVVLAMVMGMSTPGLHYVFAQETSPPEETTAGPRVKLVIPGAEPILIDTAVAGDVILVVQPDGQGVQVKSNEVDITLRRGTQPGSIAMTSPMGGTFEMMGQFAWMKGGRNVLLATVGGSPDPLSSGGGQPTGESTSPSPSTTAATTPPDTAAEAQRDPIQIVDQPRTDGGGQ